MGGEGQLGQQLRDIELDQEVLSVMSVESSHVHVTMSPGSGAATPAGRGSLSSPPPSKHDLDNSLPHRDVTHLQMISAELSDQDHDLQHSHLDDGAHLQELSTFYPAFPFKNESHLSQF